MLPLKGSKTIHMQIYRNYRAQMREKFKQDKWMQQFQKVRLAKRGNQGTGTEGVNIPTALIK